MIFLTSSLTSVKSFQTQILTVIFSAFCSLQIAEAAKTPSQADDLYLDDTGSGGYYPEDDDDFNSGSGSGESLSLSVFLTHT